MTYQPCKTCPFKETPVEAGAPDWIIDVMKGVKSGSLDHSCHQTDPRADLFVGAKKKRNCVGFLGMIKAQTGDCISPEAMREMALGRLVWGKIPTKGVFQSIQDFLRFHLKAMGINEERFLA